MGRFSIVLTEWIPCSERLPEDARNVLITLSNYDIVIPGWYNNSNKLWYRLYQGRWAAVLDDDEEFKVIAWQDFPDPYIPESEE